MIDVFLVKNSSNFLATPTPRNNSNYSWLSLHWLECPHISEGRPHISLVTQTVVKQSSQRLRSIRPHLVQRGLQESTAHHEQDLIMKKKIIIKMNKNSLGLPDLCCWHHCKVEFQLAAHTEQFLETDVTFTRIIFFAKFTKCINIRLECVRVVVTHFYYFRSHPQYAARRLLKNAPELGGKSGGVRELPVCTAGRSQTTGTWLWPDRSLQFSQWSCHRGGIYYLILGLLNIENNYWQLYGCGSQIFTYE